MKAIINGIKSAAEYAVALRRVPVVTVTGGVKAFTVYQALVVPAKLHAATKLALSPHKTVSHAHHCCKEMINGVKCIAELEGSEFRVAGMASLRAGCCALQAAGGIAAGIGILLDAITVYSAGKELYKDTKCKVSRNISSHIEKLEDLNHRLVDLEKQLTIDIRSQINN